MKRSRTAHTAADEFRLGNLVTGGVTATTAVAFVSAVAAILLLH
jgi:hypothetical protein